MRLQLSIGALAMSVSVVSITLLLSPVDLIPIQMNRITRGRTEASTVTSQVRDISRRAVEQNKRVTIDKTQPKQEPLVAARAFQSRMMQADTQQPAQHKSGELYMTQDSWQPHNRMPNLNDQDQADEMLGLASERDVDQLKIAPGPKESPNNAKIEPQEQDPRVAASQLAQNNASAKKRPPMDEYYSDDDEDEEELSKPLKEEFERQERKETKTREPEIPLKPIQSNFSQVDSRRRPTSESNWSPSASMTPMAESVKIKPEITDVKSKSETQGRKMDAERTSKGSLAELFGSRETFGGAMSKTDAAIEYLRFILKSKQNSTESAFKPINSQTEQQIERLTKQTIGYNQPANLPSTFTSFNETQKLDTLTAPISNQKSQISTSRQSEKSSAAQLTGARFSIGDATPNQLLVQSSNSLASPVSGSARQHIDERQTNVMNSMISASTQLHPERAFRPVNQNSHSLVSDQAFVTIADASIQNPSHPEPPTHMSSNEGSSKQTEYRLSTAAGGDQTIKYDKPPKLVGLEEQQAKQIFHQTVSMKQNSHNQQQTQAEGSLVPEQTYISHGQENSQGGPISSRFFHMQQPARHYSMPSDVLQQQAPIGNAYAPIQEIRHESDARLNSQESLVNPVHQHVMNSLAASIGGNISDSWSKSINDKQERIQLPPQFNQNNMNTNEDHVPNQKVSSSPMDIPNKHKATKVELNLPLDKPKAPKIVSYNYFESPNEQSEAEIQATNYQLGDALLQSNGGLDQMLSPSELEAIQNQFLSLDQPTGDQEPSQSQGIVQPASLSESEANLAGLLAGLKPADIQQDSLQKLSSTNQQAEESMRELASNGEPTSVIAPSQLSDGKLSSKLAKQKPSESSEIPKKKSLIVYLNHPRSDDMSAKGTGERLGLAQSVADQPQESFITAKEFDSQGLSMDSKHLDISSLRGLGDSTKDGSNVDKDGLSVVVIGDAYKYKKIVLLISSKSGGLKFIPMVKDMKK